MVSLNFAGVVKELQSPCKGMQRLSPEFAKSCQGIAKPSKSWHGIFSIIPGTYESRARSVPVFENKLASALHYLGPEAKREIGEKESEKNKKKLRS